MNETTPLSEAETRFVSVVGNIEVRLAQIDPGTRKLVGAMLTAYALGSDEARQKLRATFYQVLAGSEDGLGIADRFIDAAEDLREARAGIVAAGATPERQIDLAMHAGMVAQQFIRDTPELRRLVRDRRREWERDEQAKRARKERKRAERKRRKKNR